MNDEPTLFDHVPLKHRFEPEPQTRSERQRRMARQSDPQTSWDAIPKPARRSETKRRILNLLGQHPEGLTSSEVAKLLDIDKGSSSKRLGDLEHEGYLETCGTRESDRGRQSSIYRRKIYLNENAGGYGE